MTSLPQPGHADGQGAFRAPFLSRMHEWIATADHKKLGVMYVTTGLIFFLIGGLEATMMRWQLAVPGNTILSPEDFNRLFTMHGTTMVFLVGMPILLGVANYFVPLQMGARMTTGIRTCPPVMYRSFAAWFTI